MNINLSTREKVMLVALGIVAIVFIGAKLFIFPAYSALCTDKAKLREARLSAGAAQSKISQAKNASSLFDDAFTQAKDAAHPLLPSLDKPSLQLWVLDLAKSSGMTVQSILIGDPAVMQSAGSPSSSQKLTVLPSSPSPSSPGAASSGAESYGMKVYADALEGKTGKVPVGTGDAITADISLKLTGSYDGAKSFLDTVRKTGRFAAVTSFRLSPGTGGLSCDTSIRVYAAQKLDGSDRIFAFKLPDPTGQKNLM